MPSQRFLEVFTTTGNKKDAEMLARVLVEMRLAACVQILGPIHSIYRWKGTVESSEEWLCIVKTREPLYEKLQKAITDMHSYEVPQILALSVSLGNPPYFSWLQDELSRE